MIEVNRRLYMDEGKKTEFEKACAAVGRIIVIAAKAFAKAGSPEVCSARQP
jgi:hypothetical protein